MTYRVFQDNSGPPKDRAETIAEHRKQQKLYIWTYCWNADFLLSYFPLYLRHLWLKFVHFIQESLAYFTIIHVRSCWLMNLSYVRTSSHKRLTLELMINKRWVNYPKHLATTQNNLFILAKMIFFFPVDSITLFLLENLF